MTPGQAVMEALAVEGVDLIFGLSGSHILGIYDALAERPDIRLVTVKHENSAALMAETYGRLTGRPGVALTTAGPGATNALSGVGQAYDAAAPMVHLSGTVPLGAGYESFHGCDDPDFLHRLFADLTKLSLQVRSAAEIPEALARAFHTAASGRPGPVHVDIPQDVLQAGPTEIPPYQPLPTEERTLSPEEREAALARFREAKNIVIVAGKGVLRQRGAVPLTALAETLEAPVICTRDGRGAVPGNHPLALGHYFHFDPNPVMLDLLEKADLGVVVGARYDAAQMDGLRPHLPESIVYLGLDEEPVRVEGAEPSAAVHAGAALGDLLERLPEKLKPEDPALRARIARMRRLHREGYDRLIETPNQMLHYGLALRELVGRAGEDAMFFGDVGSSFIWLENELAPRLPDSHVQPGQYGAMGYAPPGAIAAKLIYPERQVVGILGDGALLMGSADFNTAVEQGANILLFVLKDNRYGIVDHLHQRAYGRSFGCELKSPDFVKWAESFGACGLRISRREEIEAVVTRALEETRRRPVVVEVETTHEFPYPRVADLMEGV